MSLLHHSHKGFAAYALLAITIIFIGGVFVYFPNFKDDYISSYKFMAHAAWIRAQDVLNLNRENKIDTTNDPDFAVITEFGTTTEVVVILEPEAISIVEPIASTSEEYLATELEGFKPSPESVWASLYLNTLNMKQNDLKLDIRYVKEWQTSGGLARDLTLNSKGADVRLVQYLLAIFDPAFKLSFVTGTYGPQTKAAIARFQQKVNIKPTGVFSEETRFFFDSVYFKELCPDADPEQDKSFENVSRRISVPLDYIPSDLIRLPRSIRSIGVMCLSKEPSKRLGEMFADARNEGHELAVFSAYRSSNTQRLLTTYYLKTMGKAGLAGVAESGHSEHQLGTTIDISGKSIQYAGPSSLFGAAKEGEWLQANSYKYGFIMSYPQGKQGETGYIYEPWHFRYVGVDIAKDIRDEGLTIQQYFDLVNGNNPVDPLAAPENQ